MNKFFHWLEKVSSWTTKAFNFVASMMMAGLMIILCVDLTLRYVFNSPLIWGTEVTEILLLYITFLGAITFADVGKAGRLLGYAPKVPIREGLARYVAWYRASAGGTPRS